MMLYVHGKPYGLLGTGEGEDGGAGKLQALVYDILPLEEGAGKRCSAACGVRAHSEHRFPAPSSKLCQI